MKGATAVVRCLQEQGVETIFGYPGGAIMPVFDALYDYTRNKTFHHVLVRHEQGFRCRQNARVDALAGTGNTAHVRCEVLAARRQENVARALVEHLDRLFHIRSRKPRAFGPAFGLVFGLAFAQKA